MSNFYTQKWRKISASKMVKFPSQYSLNVLCFEDLKKTFLIWIVLPFYMAILFMQIKYFHSHSEEN